MIDAMSCMELGFNGQGCGSVLNGMSSVLDSVIDFKCFRVFYHYLVPLEKCVFCVGCIVYLWMLG